MLVSPVFEGGKNLICAADDTGKLAGYIPLHPHLMKDSGTPHLIWANMVVSPAFIDSKQLRDLILEHAIIRVKEITGLTPGHPARMWFQHHVSEVEAIEYVVSRGATYGDSVLRMVVDLSGDTEVIPAPGTIEVKYWDIQSDEEISDYVVARNEALGMPVTVPDWRHFLLSVVGNNGTTIAAFDRDKLVGAVSAYWLEDENRRLGKTAGWTENVFVLAPWRGMGIADTMISMACRYLNEHGMTEAQLDPGASNRRAVRAYQRLGYKIVDESRQYWLEIQTGSINF
jgi:ribosomal protein S18 acetylase RimI-like enzyme